MLEKAGLRTKILRADQKRGYHLSCSIASNLVCGLYEIAKRHLQDVGFDEREAMAAVAPLARANLENILQKGPSPALSGPVERGDADTVAKHLELLTDRKEQDVYRKLSLVLTELAKEKHPEKNYTDICRLLED
jgi:predicted short-subunit dehydrogenase-like oxidoreductase (DUF2520 family)